MNAQTFKIVGVETPKASANELLDIKDRVLGTKFTVEFYNNDVRATLYWRHLNQPQTVVYSKNANGNYIFTYPVPNLYEVLKFNTWAKYIRGGVIEMYSKAGQKHQLLLRYTFERN